MGGTGRKRSGRTGREPPGTAAAAGGRRVRRLRGAAVLGVSAAGVADSARPRWTSASSRPSAGEGPRRAGLGRDAGGVGGAQDLPAPRQPDLLGAAGGDADRRRDRRGAPDVRRGRPRVHEGGAADLLLLSGQVPAQARVLGADPGAWRGRGHRLTPAATTPAPASRSRAAGSGWRLLQAAQIGERGAGRKMGAGTGHASVPAADRRAGFSSPRRWLRFAPAAGGAVRGSGRAENVGRAGEGRRYGNRLADGARKGRAGGARAGSA